MKIFLLLFQKSGSSKSIFCVWWDLLSCSLMSLRRLGHFALLGEKPCSYCTVSPVCRTIRGHEVGMGLSITSYCGAQSLISTRRPKVVEGEWRSFFLLAALRAACHAGLLGDGFCMGQAGVHPKMMFRMEWFPCGLGEQEFRLV